MRIGIVTIVDNNNYGNRLQNYATQEILKKIVVSDDIKTIKNYTPMNYKSSNIVKFIIKSLKYKIKILLDNNGNKERYKAFLRFNKNITFASKLYTPYNSNKIDKECDIFFVGSDQVWNPNGRMTDIDLLKFTSNDKKNSFAASIAVNEFPNKEKREIFKNEISNFKTISVREDRGKEIIEELTDRKDIEVLIDPTMLLSIDDWNFVLQRPKQLKNDKFILNYFLGELSEVRKREIERIARENDCEIINILDKKSPFYQTGPSEFLYLEKNAFLICTDSFHSSVFAILYDKPFIVFNREDKNVSMNSRIETLLSKFNLKDRIFEGKITEENLKHDYTEAYKILEIEREKSYKFLERALKIDEDE